MIIFSLLCVDVSFFFFFSSRRRHTRCSRDWSSDVCSSDLIGIIMACVSLVAGSLTGMGGSGMGMSARALGFGMGVGAVIVAPIVYGIIGGVGAGLGAVVYNLAARWVGGLEVDIS